VLDGAPARWYVFRPPRSACVNLRKVDVDRVWSFELLSAHDAPAICGVPVDVGLAPVGLIHHACEVVSVTTVAAARSSACSGNPGI
jgi:hypothetical protein